MNPDREAREGERLERRARFATLGGIFAMATAAGLLVATQNYLALTAAARPQVWWHLALAELPVWYCWAALIPVILWLGRRLPVFGRRAVPNVILHLPLSLSAVVIVVAVTLFVRFPFMSDQFPPGSTFGGLIYAATVRSFAAFMFIYFAILGFGEALRYYRSARARELRESRLEARLAQAQLHALRGQLQPHFLFNTLHMISALMTREPQTARRMITRLSDLLRLSLEEDESYEVTLDEELEFLDLYVDIQRQRFGERLRVTHDIAEDARRLLVPRLILQPLVENSIVHGLSRREGEGRIEVMARRADGLLRLAVLDNGPGIDRPIEEGIGLRNTRERLRQQHGESATFHVFNREHGGLAVRITMPARLEEDEEQTGTRDPERP